MHPSALAAFAALLGAPLVRDAAPTGRSVDLAVARSARALVPAGAFRMGSDEEDIARIELLCMREGGSEALCDGGRYVEEMPPRDVGLPAFRIDRTEVTAAAYERCVQAGVCRGALAFPGDRRFDGPTQPIVGVSWDDATTYCRWVGARLPTEAEWERAARGVDGRTFPWGRAWNPSLSNGRPARPGAFDPDGFRYTAPVGSFPDGASPYGLLDMAGNAWEWVEDFYGEYQPTSTFAPRGPQTGPFRIVRGGSWTTQGFWQRGAMRLALPQEHRALETGFRCAEDA